MWFQRYSYPNALTVARSEETQLQALADKLPVRAPHRLRCDSAGGARALRSSGAFGLHFLPCGPHSCPALRLSGVVVCCPAHRKNHWRRSVGPRETILCVLSLEPAASCRRLLLLTHSQSRQRFGEASLSLVPRGPTPFRSAFSCWPRWLVSAASRGLAEGSGEFAARKPVGSPGVHDHHCRPASRVVEEETNQ